MYFFAGEDIAKHTIYCHGPGNGDKRIKDHIDIIISKTENIYKGKKLDEHITLQIIPPGIIRGKETSILTFISTVKNIGKIFWGAVEKQFIFFHTQIMIAPCIIHISILAIVDPDPSIKNASHYLEQKQNNQLGIAKPWFFKEAKFRN